MKKILCTCLTAAAAFAFLSAAAANLPGKLSEDGRTFWIDGGDLPLEGRGFADAEKLYQRIPDRLKAVTNVNRGVWIQGQCSAGMLFRFDVRKSNLLKVRWSVHYEKLAGGNMGPIVKSGADAEAAKLTRMDPHSLGKWRVNATLRNIENFYKAFGIKEGDPMWLDPAKRVNIW